MATKDLSFARLAQPHPAEPALVISSAPDEELITLMKSGRGEALSALFDRYFRLVLCVALRILRDAGEAEDLMQDVFLEIYKRACLFDASKGSAKTWILQYAYHRSMNRRQYLIARRFYKSEEISALELGRWEPSYSPNGWDGLTCEERKRMLKKGMESLGDKQKRVLELAYSEGLLIKEIAERMGEPVQQVRSYYYRGLKKLREVLHETSKQDGPGAKGAGAAD
ncbi:MAG TPA: sigma-70 family RNA polymerase sigma factor [Candidatus Elarobacter sp.]|nr:sigma-70 family RNA polymerase sigma factor [Candidatus Elarobacter sp.]